MLYWRKAMLATAGLLFLPFVSRADDGTIQTMRIKAKDGFTFEIAYRVPPGKGPFPVLIHQHGTVNQFGVDRLKKVLGGASRFYAAGYIIVAPTHRSTKNVPADYDGWLWDLLAVVEAVQKLPKADPDSIVYYGHSGGGSLGLDLAAAGAPLAAIAVGEPACTVFARMHQSADRGERIKVDARPHDYYTEEVKKYTEGQLAKIKTPVFFAQGTIHAINIITKEIIYPTLKKMDKNVTMKVYEGKGHGYFSGPNAIFDDLQPFYKKHLKVQSGSSR